MPSAKISTVNLDLGNTASVRDCAKKLLDSGSAFDVVINNAGAWL